MTNNPDKIYMASYRPLTHYSFREPGLFTAGTHGPASHGRSLPYPPPSTLVGSLLTLLSTSALQENHDDQAEQSPQEVIRRALARFLYSDYRIYAGLARRIEHSNPDNHCAQRKETLVFFPPHYYIPLESNGGTPSLRKLLETILDRIIEQNAFQSPFLQAAAHRVIREYQQRIEEAYRQNGKQSGVVRVVTRSHIGIALDRGRKTAAEAMLYQMEQIDPRATPLEYLQLITIKEGDLREGQAIIPLATKGTPTLATLTRCLQQEEQKEQQKLQQPQETPNPIVDQILNLNNKDTQEEAHCLIYLANPALLPESPWQTTVTITPQTLEQLAQKLLSSNSENNDEHGNATILHVPPLTPGLETLSPGILSRPYPRLLPPHLHIPPATIIYTKTQQPTNLTNKLIQRGLGEGNYAQQGWGTPIILCR